VSGGEENKQEEMETDQQSEGIFFLF